MTGGDVKVPTDDLACAIPLCAHGGRCRVRCLVLCWEQVAVGYGRLVPFVHGFVLIVSNDRPYLDG
jgi:hypothetical protein